MNNKKQVFIHIGTQKTGTTSIQNYMYDNRDFHTYNFGVSFYNGIHSPKNHAELHASAMRKDRSSPFKLSSKIDFGEAYKNKVKNNVRSFLDETNANKIVFSAEGLSYLRHSDEILYLKHLFEDSEVYIIVYFREKSSFLHSYGEQFKKTKYTLSKDVSSFAYVEDDTWLIKYEELISIYGSHFGRDRLIIFNYEDCLEKDKSVVPSFLRTIGVPFKMAEVVSYWDNISMEDRGIILDN
jgi:hypothetical protein